MTSWSLFKTNGGFNFPCLPKPAFSFSLLDIRNRIPFRVGAAVTAIAAALPLSKTFAFDTLNTVN